MEFQEAIQILNDKYGYDGYGLSDGGETCQGDILKSEHPGLYDYDYYFMDGKLCGEDETGELYVNYQIVKGIWDNEGVINDECEFYEEEFEEYDEILARKLVV